MCAIYSHIVTFVRKVFDIFSEIFIIRPTRRRGVRVAEGAPLLREYRVCSSIEGSNPSLSTIFLNGASCKIKYGRIAQLDRVPGYEPGGRRFESSCAHHTLLSFRERSA